MRSIGEVARDSGLGVSALRFYDRAGVLVPAWVDPVSGYRWYRPEQVEEARLLARLRRAGLPLADIRLVLAGWSSANTDLVRRLLQTHLRRLERGLADARSEFSTVQELLERKENPMALPSTTAVRLTVFAPDLAAALDAVRFAAGADPELPMLGGVLFDIEGEALQVVATDRYRMAVARAGTCGYGGTRVQAVVPVPLADAMRALLGGMEEESEENAENEQAAAELVVDGDRVTLEIAGRQAAGQCLDHDFPDYRRLVRLPAGRRALVDVPAFQDALKTGPIRASEVCKPGEVSCDLSVLKVTADDTVTICGDDDDDPDQVAVNRDYLLHALAAASRDQLILELGAATAPLAIRRPDTEDTFSILMPVRLGN